MCQTVRHVTYLTKVKAGLIAHVAQYEKSNPIKKKMDGRSEYTFLQIRHTEDQEAHEKMLNITNY